MWAPVKHAVDRRAVTEHQDVIVTVFYPFVPIDRNVIDSCDALKIPLNDAHRLPVHLGTEHFAILFTNTIPIDHLPYRAALSCPHAPDLIS